MVTGVTTVCCSLKHNSSFCYTKLYQNYLLLTKNFSQPSASVRMASQSNKWKIYCWFLFCPSFTLASHLTLTLLDIDDTSECNTVINRFVCLEQFSANSRRFELKFCSSSQAYTDVGSNICWLILKFLLLLCVIKYYKMVIIKVCGNPDFSISLLKSVATHKGISPSDDLAKWLWEVLEEFTPDERSLFLRFVWGRNRLPRTIADFRGRDFVIQVSCGWCWRCRNEWWLHGDQLPRNESLLLLLWYCYYCGFGWLPDSMTYKLH